MSTIQYPISRTRFCKRRATFSKLAVWVGVLLACVAAHAADVSFKSAFQAATAQDVMVISVPEGDTLIIEAGTYYTEGKPLLVSASRAKVAGEARIGFYNPDVVPPTKPGVGATGPGGAPGAHVNCSRSGCPGLPGQLGLQGASGETGKSASFMVLNVPAMDIDGRLTLVAAGQVGGQAQKGGKGGSGGPGGNGAKRSCGGALGLDTRAGPGNGGDGGVGGSGGPGGPGGPGGSGGVITYSSKLKTLVDTNKIVIDLQPAAGGKGGLPGDPGDGAGGGGMGGGNSCGGGGRTGNSNGPGPGGTPGPKGAPGAPGKSRAMD